MPCTACCQIEVVDLQVLFRQYPSGMTVPSDRVGEGLVTIPNAHLKVSVHWCFGGRSVDITLEDCEGCGLEGGAP